MPSLDAGIGDSTDNKRLVIYIESDCINERVRSNITWHHPWLGHRITNGYDLYLSGA